MKHCHPRWLTSWLALAVIVLTAGGIRPSLALAQDVTPPAIQALDFNPKSVDVTVADQTVAINMHLTDDSSGVLEGFLYFVSPSGLRRQVDVFDPSDLTFGSDRDGTYATTITFPAFSETGQWRIESLYLQDKAGNHTILSGDQLAALQFPTVLQVNVIPAQPQIVSFDFTPRTVDVTTGDRTVTVTLHVTEPVNGINYSLVRFDAPASGGPEAKGILLDASCRISGDARDGVYQGQVVIPAADTPGDWAASLYVQDMDGHYTVQLDPPHLQALGFPGYLTVVYASDAIAGTVYKYTEGSVSAAGVPVTLLDGSGTQIGSAVTDANGYYTFGGLFQGTYTVAVSTPAGYAAIAAFPGAGGGGTALSASQIRVSASAPNTLYQPNDFVINPVNNRGCYVTLEQCDWWLLTFCNAPGGVSERYFSMLYPQGLKIGGNYSLSLTSAAAVHGFLPQSGFARALTANAVNPARSALCNVFAGDVLALQMSVDFSNAGVTRSGLANLPAYASGKLAGKTVGQVLGLANTALGGAPSAVLPCDLDRAVEAILDRYRGGLSCSGCGDGR